MNKTNERGQTYRRPYLVDDGKGQKQRSASEGEMELIVDA